MTVAAKRRTDWDGAHAPPDVERDTAELLGELRTMGSRLTSVVDELEALCSPDGDDEPVEEGESGAGGTPQQRGPSAG